MTDFIEGVWKPYIKRPIQIQAIELKHGVKVDTLEGIMYGRPGDFVVRGIEGEVYPVKRDIFLKTYDPAVEPLPVAPQPAAPAAEHQPHWREDWPECHCFHKICCGLSNRQQWDEKCKKCKWRCKQPAPGAGASDSNDPKQEEYKRRLAQYEEECKRPRPDIVEAIEREVRKRGIR